MCQVYTFSRSASADGKPLCPCSNPKCSSRVRLAAEMAEEMSIPSLSLIAPGKILDEAACDRIRDAIAIECEALLTKLDAEKEATLTAFEKQAQEQMDQIQSEIEAEQLAIQQKKLADQEKIFKQQLKVRPRQMRFGRVSRRTPFLST